MGFSSYSKKARRKQNKIFKLLRKIIVNLGFYTETSSHLRRRENKHFPENKHREFAIHRPSMQHNFDKRQTESRRGLKEDMMKKKKKGIGNTG